MRQVPVGSSPSDSGVAPQIGNQINARVDSDVEQWVAEAAANSERHDTDSMEDLGGLGSMPDPHHDSGLLPEAGPPDMRLDHQEQQEVRPLRALQSLSGKLLEDLSNRV